MFKTLLCKQSSGFCVTGTNMQRWFGDEITNCPNCGVFGENSAHLLHCPDAGRLGLFRQEVTSLQAWLEQSHTHPEMARLLPQYILGRGAVKFASLPILSVDILRLAHQQDTIGWDNFMEGKISQYFSTVQYTHLQTADSILTSYTTGHISSSANCFTSCMVSGFTATYPKTTLSTACYAPSNVANYLERSIGI
jgi:hypothetical protein